MVSFPDVVLKFKSLSSLSHAGRQPVTQIWSYGPINGFLACYVPVHRRYLIKPQMKIRPAVWNELGGDEAMLRISPDSYSGEVLSRDEKWGEDAVKMLI